MTTDANSQTDTNSLESPDNKDNTPLDYEALAQEQGWQPEDKFRGDPGNFVDAKTYYERSRTVTPIIKAENRALRAEIERIRSDASKALQIAEQSREREVVALKVELQEALFARKEAIGASDGDAFETADKRAKALEQEIAASQPIKPQQAPQVDPRFKAWLDAPEQAWFREDEEARAMAEGLVTMDRYKPLYDKHELLWNKVAADVKQRIDAIKGDARKDLERPGPQGAGRGNGEVRTRAGAKSFDNLLPDFQKTCDRMFKDFNPPGTKDKWRERYVAGCTDDAFRK